MKKLIAGNWKMHGDKAMAKNFSTDMQAVSDMDHVEWLICAPFPYITQFESVQRGAQDCSAHETGAYTGEISAAMLDDIGCAYCIVGHSERRMFHKETNTMVKDKAAQVIGNDMTAIICVGETLEEREAGSALPVVETQIIESLPSCATASNTVIAYEPVWAIGTGKAATTCDVEKMHNFIRDLLSKSMQDGANTRILYGGSVKPSNAEELLNLDNVNGALIGGASLQSSDFIAIGKAVKN